MDDKIIQVSALYDSHVHWLMTGEKKSYLDLQGLTMLSDITKEMMTPKNFRGDWLFGFGWNDSQLSKESPKDEFSHLDINFPVCFIKKDAHSCLLNSVALNRVLPALENNPALTGFIERDQTGQPTGILKESAFYALYPMFPELTDAEIENYLLQAQDHFWSQGFSHIRDMTCSLSQWGVLKELERNSKLKIFADINFHVDHLSHARDVILPFVLAQKNETFKHLKIKGLKFFADGSLGSQTAWLSENYKNSDQPGQCLWTNEDMYQLMKVCWQNDLEVSVHTLGDKAVDTVVEIARKLYSEKVRGYLNLEHVELISSETIVKLKSLYVRCHMQPSHWLSDKNFINDRLQVKTKKNLFLWEALRKAKVPVSFGSDSPIEESDIKLTFLALKDSAKHGIDEFTGNFFDFYTHPQPSEQGKKIVTLIKDFEPLSVG